MGPVGALGMAGFPGLIKTAKVCALVVPQELVAVTVMFPLTAEVVAVTVTELDVAPAVIVHPLGNDQV